MPMRQTTAVEKQHVRRSTSNTCTGSRVDFSVKYAHNTVKVK